MGVFGSGLRASSLFFFRLRLELCFGVLGSELRAMIQRNLQPEKEHLQLTTVRVERGAIILLMDKILHYPL